jgi:hypothetical protein
VSFSHKAYAFDYALFETELAPLLYQALSGGDTARLAQFVDRHRDALTWPWDPEPLPVEWREELQTADVHSIGDLALTKYYDSGDDNGLAEEWSRIQAQLPDECRATLLGRTFGPQGNHFDPGKMGSYVQDEDAVRRSAALLSQIRMPNLDRYVALLVRARDKGLGLYVTF